MEANGKTVWITGASSGIGAALARECARRGARVLLSARNRERLEAVQQECRDEARRRDLPEPDARALVLPFDLEDRAALREAPKRALDRVGSVDWLINNAGMGQRGTVLETETEIVERLLAVDFLAATVLTRGVLPGMVERGAGRVAAVTSLLGKFGAPRRSAYAAAKHALHGWFDSLRGELAGTGVGVTLLVPGWVRSEISLRALEGDGREHARLDPGQARGLSPDECARRMFRALSRGIDEQLIGGFECAGAYANRFFPRWFARRLAKIGIG